MFHIKRRPALHSDATAAIADAQLQFQLIESRTDEVHKIAASMREVRHRNHFAEQIAMLIEKRG